jgi:DNA-binding CsgD family transcriptional regulator
MPLRDTGIQVMPHVPWGTHLCVFYDTKDDLLDTCVRWFEAGLANREFCLWVVSDPITEQDAEKALHEGIAGCEKFMRGGQLEILDGNQWYLDRGRVDTVSIIAAWYSKLDSALSEGYSGLRVNGTASWIGSLHWESFYEYEEELDRATIGRRMLVLCTYSLQKSSALDVLDVARVHQSSIARRNGEWEFLQTPDLKAAKQEIRKLSGALRVLSKPFPGHNLLTRREHMALAQILRGASNKEAARILGVSPRTVEFHRANILKKLGAKNTVELLSRMLSV